MNTLFMVFICVSFLLFILEILTPGTFFFFSFAIGFLFSSISAFWIKDLYILLLITAAISILTFIILRKFDIFYLKKISNKTNIDSYIGKKAFVLSVNGNNSYRVKVYSEEWNAVCSTPLAVGDSVEITGRESLLLYVKKI